MKPLVVLFVACLGVAQSDMYSTFPRIPEVFPNLYRNTRVLKDGQAPMDQSELRGMIRTQSAKMAEMSLSSKSAKELHCFKRTLCIVGATMESRQNGRSALSPTTLAKGVDQFRQILELMVEDIAQSRQEKEEDYPNIHQVLGSHVVGASTRDLDMCHKLFHCTTSAEDFNVPASFRGGHQEGRSGVGCGAVDAICPGVAIGCSLCSVYAPGTCGDQCIIAGIYCGTSALACAHDAKLKDAAAVVAQEEEEAAGEKQEEEMKMRSIMFGSPF